MNRRVMPTASPVRLTSVGNGCSSVAYAPMRILHRRTGVPALCFSKQVEYDAATNVAYWETRPVLVTQRLLQIGWQFGRWAVSTRLSGPDSTNGGPAGMRQVLTKLGPAFVKIGQALSSRPDVMDPAYLKELELLQDRIPPFSNEEAFAVIEQDLGRPLTSLFTSITPDPVAAASLGQVYRARLAPAIAAEYGLRPHTAEGEGGGGIEVAVKVQRPGVADSIALDTYILRLLAAVLRQARKLNTDLPSLVDEWATSLFRELDYTREAANGTRFSELYGHLPKVCVPKMYEEITTGRVLVMEWINGRRLRSNEPAPFRAGRSGVAGGASGESVEDIELALVDVGVQCSLEQMLAEGFYHADPHPGNLLRTEDGRLAFLDFGMMGQVTPETRAALINATLHMVNREYPELAIDLMALGLLPPGSERSQIVPALTGVFEEALQGGVSNLSFGALSTNLGQTMYQYKFRIPPYYTLLVRSLTVLEGIALSYDRDYKVLGAAYPWIARRLLSGSDPLLEDTLQTLLYKNNRFQFTRLESLMKQAIKSPPRLQRPQQQAAPAELQVQPQGTQRPEQQLTDTLQRLLPLQLPFELPAWLPSASCPLTSLLDSGLFPPTGESPLSSTSTFRPPFNSRSSSSSSSALQLVLSIEGGKVRRILVNEAAAGLDAAWRVYTEDLLTSIPLIGAGGRFGLAGLEDREQLEGLGMIAGVLSAANAAQRSAGATEGAGGGSPQQQSLEQTVSILNWIVREVGSLPPSQRQQGMQLVREVLEQLASRMTARTLRSLLAV